MILLVPYFTGAAVGLPAADGSVTRVLLGLPAVLLLFVSRPGAMTLIKRRHMDGDFGADAASLASGSLISATTAAVLLLFLSLSAGFSSLLLLAVAGAALFCFHLWRILARRERSVSGELAGILMLTLTAPLACYLASADLDRGCWKLWLLNSLYFGASVFYVKMKLRASARKQDRMNAGLKLKAGRPTLIYIAFMVISLSLAVLLGFVTPSVTFAYLPAAIYMLLAIVTLRPGADIRLEGIVQTALAVLFGVLLVVAWVA